jgi:anthranilate synthase component 1
MIATPLERSVDLLDVHRSDPERWPFLLASSATSDHLGRWSMLLRRNAEPAMVANDRQTFYQQFKARPRLQVDDQHSPERSELPFAGGWFVYLGYEWAGELEPILALPEATDGLPAAMAVRCPAALVIDHVNDQQWLVAESLDSHQEALDALASQTSMTATGISETLPEDLRLSCQPAERFTSGVERIQDYILAGDVFQVNLSRRWHAEATSPIDPLAVYQRLMRSNPAPFAGLARLPGGTLISSSPERLVSVRNGQVQTRPIAGTRPRGGALEADLALSDELLSNLKERAEHIMLIDLERNDLGRVCQPGSVEVDELMVLESYAHVHHIVSNVRGALRTGVDAIDVLAAVFPGGTITGCPKVRCMQIIAELEGEGRGFYTGAMGYVGHDGSLDMNILIRSLCVHDREDDGLLSFRTGAGIVADSKPAAELAETESKAEGLLRALR